MTGGIHKSVPLLNSGGYLWRGSLRWMELALAISLRKHGRTGGVEDLKVDRRMTAVFQELITRHGILIRAKRWEFGWKALLLVGCTLCLALLGLGLQTGRFGSVWLYPLLLVFNLWLFAKVRAAVERSQKAAVNFGVLRHHLIGMLEVGNVCDCGFDCDCRDRFRRQALIDYGISLY